MSKRTGELFSSETIMANDVAITEVMMVSPINGEFVSASGTARTHPEDKFSPQVAELLSLGRALESLGKKLQKRANGIVKQNEDNSRRRKLAAEKAAKKVRMASSTKKNSKASR